MNSNIVLQNKTEIKKLLKINFNFIKYDGYILDKYIEYLLETNNYILDKTIQYVELLSKKSITDKFVDIIKEYETSKEITDSSLAIIQNANLQLQQIQEKHDKLQEKHDKLQENYNTRHAKSIEQLKLINDTDNNTIKEYELKIEYSKNEIVKKQTEYNLLQDNINGIFINKDEYIYKESNDIIKEPVYHLKNNFNVSDMSLNFPILVKLQENEYIIKYYYHTNNTYEKNLRTDPPFYEYDTHVFILYITNYGRLIKSDVAKFFVNKYEWETNYCGLVKGRYDALCVHPINNINANSLISYNKIIRQYRDMYNMWGKQEIIISNIIKINLIEQPKLKFYMPKLFIDVIDAFYTINTDLIQKCCKKYLDITVKNKILLSTIIDKDNNIAIKDNKIIELSTIISLQTEELEKIKLENIKLKRTLHSFI